MENHLPTIELQIKGRVVGAHKTLVSKKKKYDEIEDKDGFAQGDIHSISGIAYREFYEAEAVYNEFVELCENLDIDYQQDAYFKGYFK